MTGDLAPIPPQLLAPTEAAWVELLGDDLPEPAQRWQIDGTGSAEWALAHVAQAQAALAELNAQAEDFRARIDAWLAHESARHKATKAFFEAHLERWAVAVREADPERKTITLPSGRVSTTSRRPRMKVADEEAVLAWATRHAANAVTWDPRLLVSVLWEHVQVVKLTVAARFTHSCGCVLEAADPEGLTWPEVGSEVECSECGSAALLGNVEALETRLVLSQDVPGLVVDEGGVTAKVVVG